MTPVRGAGTTFAAPPPAAARGSGSIACGAGASAAVGAGGAIASAGSGATGGAAALSAGAAMRSSGVRQTNPSSVPDGETGAQRSLMTPSATQALSRGARAARPSHSRTAP